MGDKMKSYIDGLNDALLIARNTGKGQLAAEAIKRKIVNETLRKEVKPSLLHQFMKAFK